MENNRRRFYRLHFPKPVCAELTILGLPQLEHKKTYVAILDLSGGGCRFLSPLHFPEGTSIRVGCKFFQEELSLSGRVRWSKEGKEGGYEHGVSFIFSHQEQSRLIQLINQMSAYIRKHPGVCCSSVCSEKKCPLTMCIPYIESYIKDA